MVKVSEQAKIVVWKPIEVKRDTRRFVSPALPICSANRNACKGRNTIALVHVLVQVSFHATEREASLDNPFITK